MAKSISVRLGSEGSSFSFLRLDRDKLYGHKDRQVIDADGRRCSPAYLSSDGAALVPAGGLAMLYVDELFATVERATLKAVDETGAELALLPSTLGVEQELEGPVPAARVLDHVIHTVYQLQPETLGPVLEAELAAGRIYSGPFSFRDEYQRQTMFLLRSESGTFALVGGPHGFAFVGRGVTPAASVADEADELADDLDFNML